jgi:trk system potassium uptake protein TrkH
MAAVSLPVAWLADETAAIGAFVLTAVVSIVGGQTLYRMFRGAAPMSLRDAMLTVVLSWTGISLLGLLPFLTLAGLADESSGLGGLAVFESFWNALFESVSGFTSTGLTMAERPSELPVSLQWWRSFTQWVGAVGVIVVMLTVFHPAGDAQRLYFAEGHETSSTENVVSTARNVWWIFALYTVVGVVALRASGMTWWQALNYGMTGIATGGFGVTDGGMGDFGEAPRLVTIVVMIAGAISFSIHYRMLAARQWHALWRSPENRVLLALLIAGAVLLGLENRWSGVDGSWLDALFQFTSALTTSGFATTDISAWSPGSLLLLSLAMWCGGDAGATTGGLKVKRVITVVKGAAARIRGVALHPWRLMERKAMAGEADANQGHARTLEAAAVMVVLWALAVLGGTVLLLHASGPGSRLDHVLLEASSALGNVGLSSGVTSPELAWHGKLALVLLMWLGRLEIIPVLVLVAALFVGRGHQPNSGSKGAS